MQESSSRSDRLTPIFGSIAIAAVVVLLFGPLLVMALFSRSLTPDIVYRWDADGSALAYVLAGGLLACVLAFMPHLIDSGRSEMGKTAGLYLGSMLFLFVLGTGMEAMDIEGSHNPYVRSEPAYPRQYEELASARRFPRVADQMRLAASDGVVTKGEAYDILNGDVLRDARFEQGRRKAERARAEVLSTR